MILLILALPTILSFITPLEWFWRFSAFVLLATFALELRSVSAFDEGPLPISNFAVLEFLWCLPIIIFLVRLAMQAYRNKKQNLKAVPKCENINIADRILVIASAIIFPLFLIKRWALDLEGLSNGFLIHFGIGAAASVLGFVVIFALKKLKFANRNWSILIYGPFLTIAAISFLGIFYPYLVIQDATTKAKNDPYCVSFSKTKRAVRSLEDLAFFTMNKDINRYDHHALLIIDRNGQMEPYHWSYTKFKFVAGANQWGQKYGASRYCRPDKNFFQNLKPRNDDINNYTESYRNGHYWKINTSYSPYFSGHYISISAKAPDFKPAACPRGLNPSIEMHSRSKIMESTFPGYSNYKPTGKIGDLNIGPSDTDYDLYYRVDEDNRLLTLVSCYSKISIRTPEFACQHRFYKNGDMYSFDHSVELLTKSPQMEQDLINLFESFKEPYESKAILPDVDSK